MPANYRPRGAGPGGRYYNNGGYNGPRPSYHPPPHKPAPGNMPRPMNQSPQKQNKPAPKNESAGVSKPTPIKQETKVQKVEPTIDANTGTNDSASKIKKFTQRSRLFVGNMPSDVTDEEFKELFKKYGEISETFVHASKGFGFVRLDTRANAERAKLELNGHTIKGRDLKIRFASHGAALSLKHLSPYVSNELLESAFARFGPVERAVVIADDRGRSTGRGIVEFARKTSATKALGQISEGCFLLTSSPQAIVAKPLDQEDTEDGLPEKNIHKTQQYTQEREAPPRFSLPGTFEHEFALRWKALDEMERQQQDQLNKNIAGAREKLEIEMENAIHEHKTMLMKQELIRRQEELSRIEEQRKRDLDRRKQLEYEREDRHKKELEALAKRQEILRAQIEGTYPGSGDAPSRGPRNIPGGFGGPPPMARDSPMDYMGGGQGSLGPAPNLPSHSSKSCPMRAGNIMKIIGTSGLIMRDKKFYDLMTKFENSSAKECLRKDIDLEPRYFTLLPTCPDMSACQSIGSWKFEMLTCKINRMFAQRSLKKPKFILYFLPIGPFPDFIHEFKLAGLSLMEIIGAFLKSFFIGSELKFLAEVDMSNFPVRSRYHKLSGKLQYHVSDLLLQLQKKLPPDGFAIIGLSWYDLYPCENLNFILGQGSCPHSACVASFGRFDPNFIKGFKGQEEGILPEDMKDITDIDGGVLWKLMKVLSHETCHVLGLSHCTIFECLMNESKSSSEALSQPLYMCPVCMSKIQHLQVVLRTNTNSDKGTVASHLSSLHQFFTSTFEGDQTFECEKLRETRTWLYDMIQYLDA